MRPLLRLFPLVLFAFAFAPMACSGNVEDQRMATTSGAAGAGGSSAMPLSCGDMPTEGEIVSACIPMDGDYCLPAENSPGLLAELAKKNNICAETSPSACCGQAAYRQVVCDQPPGTDTCCYDVHYLEKVVCP